MRFGIVASTIWGKPFGEVPDDVLAWMGPQQAEGGMN